MRGDMLGYLGFWETHQVLTERLQTNLHPPCLHAAAMHTYAQFCTEMLCFYARILGVQLCYQYGGYVGHRDGIWGWDIQGMGYSGDGIFWGWDILGMDYSGDGLWGASPKE